MKPSILVLLVLCSFTSCITDEMALPYWMSDYKNEYKESPNDAAKQWFQEAKLGMFVHLNLASLCENGKEDYILWQQGNAPQRLLDYVGVSKTEYNAVEDKNVLLFERYKLEKFNADDICALAVKAKMKYITFTTQHLGLCYNFETKTSDFNSLNAPVGRDLVGELYKACKAHGLALFLYLPPDFARTDDERKSLNFEIINELLTNYGDIGGLWFDGIGLYYKNPENYAQLSETYEYVKSIQPHCLISFKEGAIGKEDFLSPEHFMLPFPYEWDTEGKQARWDIRNERWDKYNAGLWDNTGKYTLREVNTVMQKCYGRDAEHVRSGWINDESAPHLTANEVYYWFTYARYTGSNMLMNIGPRADGSIHPDDKKALIEFGQMIDKKGWPALYNEVNWKANNQ